MPFRRNSIVAIGLLALGIAISVLWVWSTGGIESLAGLTRVSAGFWIPLLGITSIHLAIRFVRWQFLLRRAGVRIPTRRSSISFLASLAGAATPAYLGESIRCVFLKRNHGVPLGITFAVLILERLLDVAALGVVGVACAADAPRAALLGGIVVIAALLGLGFLRAARAGALPILPQIAIPGFRVMAPAFVMSLAAWGVAAAAPAVAAWSLGRELDLYHGARVFSHSTLLGGLTLMPAGLGATGSAAVFEMQYLGFAPAQALPIVALFRLATTGFALAVGGIFLLLELSSRGRSAPVNAAEHFDEIAADYEHQYAPHIWKLLLERKVNFMIASLEQGSRVPREARVGLDFGCGLGKQMMAMRERGWNVVGMDPSTHLLRKGRAQGAPVVAGDGLALPFQNNTFDFVYTIGVLHHLPGPAAQSAAIAEICRILKPGGLLCIQETNTRNPLFVFYMGYVFPMIKTIDEGVEQWVPPDHWKTVGGMELVETRYFTFLPDTIPQPLLPFFLNIEQRLERSRLRPYAVHYMAVLRKASA